MRQTVLVPFDVNNPGGPALEASLSHPTTDQAFARLLTLRAEYLGNRHFLESPIFPAIRRRRFLKRALEVDQTAAYQEYKKAYVIGIQVATRYNTLPAKPHQD